MARHRRVRRLRRALHRRIPSRDGARRNARRIGVTVVGAGVLALGLALLVLPGPALLVIPAGLGILALEFDWARNALERVRRRLASLAERRRKS